MIDCEKEGKETGEGDENEYKRFLPKNKNKTLYILLTCLTFLKLPWSDLSSLCRHNPGT